MSGIFISYRRDDVQGWAGRLADSLRAALGKVNVFRDIDDIPLGADFELYIRERVKSCQALLVLIGPRWLGARDAQGQRRIDAPDDFVRLEITTAQRQHLLVIPMLVSGAAMPPEHELPDDLKFITRRQAYRLSDERWNEDIAKLAVTLRAALDPERKTNRNKMVLSGAAALLAITVIGFNLNTVADRRDAPAPPAPIVVNAQPVTPEPSTRPARIPAPSPAEGKTTPVKPKPAGAAKPPPKTTPTNPAPGGDAAPGNAQVVPADALQADPASAVSWVYLGTSEGSALESTTFSAATVPEPGDAIVTATDVPKRADASVRPDDCTIGKVIGDLPSNSEVTVHQLKKVESVTPGAFCVWAKVAEKGDGNAALR